MNSAAASTLPYDLLAMTDEEFKASQQFQPSVVLAQHNLKKQPSFASKIFNKRKDSDNDSIRTTNSTGGGSIRSMMFSRKHRSNTSTSTAGSAYSESGSVYSMGGASMYSNMSTSSTASKVDKYGLPKDSWVPVGF